jgi:hypothetical protein
METETERPRADLVGADGSAIPVSRGEDRTRGGDLESGRSSEGSWRKVSAAAGDLAKRNPSGAALGAFAIGIVAGAAIGALLARD